MDDLQLTDYLEHDREIPAELAVQNGVTTWNGRLAFEYRKDGLLQYRKVRFVDETGAKSFGRDRKGAATCMFLEHTIQDDPDLSSPLVITEGEFDALAVLAAGIPNVVSVPDGAQLEQEGEGKIIPKEDRAFGWLWDGAALKPHIDKFERIVLAVDSDAKGRVLRTELAVRLGMERCYWVDYPKGCKDANEVLIAHGAQVLAELVRGARPIIPDTLVAFGDIPDLGTGECFPSGFKGLDEGLGFSMMAPEIMFITGEPGSGKSEFANILGCNLANFSELPGAILQFEDTTLRVRETLLTYAIGNVPGIENRGQAREWMDKWFRTIPPQQGLDTGDDYTLEWLEKVIREARTRHGCKWIILDPWNEMEHMWDRTKTEAVYTNDALRRLKRIARAYQIILIVVVHPSKEGGKQKEIEDMDGYMISGGAAFNNKGDHIIVVHRADKSKPGVFVKIAKSKNHILMGRPGIVRMEYQPASAKFRYVGMGKA